MKWHTDSESISGPSYTLSCEYHIVIHFFNILTLRVYIYLYKLKINVPCMITCIYNQADITQSATFNSKVLNTARTYSGIALVTVAFLHWYSGSLRIMVQWLKCSFWYLNKSFQVNFSPLKVLNKMEIRNKVQYLLSLCFSIWNKEVVWPSCKTECTVARVVHNRNECTAARVV